AYYSVVETSTHWFIVYMFFHPRDWSDSFFEFDTEHENDSEGLLVSVQRDGSQYGVLKSIVTVAHKDFFSYVPSGGAWTANSQSIDGTLQMASVGDGVVYNPSLTTAEVPSGPDDRDVAYKLIDIFTPGGLWDQRANASLFA